MSFAVANSLLSLIVVLSLLVIVKEEFVVGRVEI
jgi:hypothetical protein